MGNFLKFIMGWKKDNEDIIKNIQNKKKQAKKKQIERFEEQQKIINTKINKVIEEAKEKGKNDAQEEIKKMEVENKKQIEIEEKEKEKKLVDLEKEYEKKVETIENEREDKIKELERLVNEELEKQYPSDTTGQYTV